VPRGAANRNPQWRRGAHDNLAEALRGALAAQADVAAALGSRPLLSVEQADSAGKLIDMIGELHAEAGKVRRLRVVVAGQKVRVETLAGALETQVKRWTDLSLRGDLQSSALACARPPCGVGGFGTARICRAARS